VNAAEHGEWLLDEALAETFPASDPVAVFPYSAELRRSAAQAGENAFLGRRPSQHRRVAAPIDAWRKATNAHGK
jgi:hypothetical protein